MKQESRLQFEKESSYKHGFVDGVEATQDIIANKLKDAIQNGIISVSKGSDKLFEIVNSVGKTD